MRKVLIAPTLAVSAIALATSLVNLTFRSAACASDGDHGCVQRAVWEQLVELVAALTPAQSRRAYWLLGCRLLTALD